MDTSAHSRAALEAASQLASALGAEISGLYIEDADLLDLCRYPFAREIGMFPSRSRRLETSELERDFRIQAERIRQMMQVSAGSSEIPWSLTVRRGRVSTEILEQAPSADLIVIGRLGRSLTGRRLGSTVRRLIEQGRGRMALILREGAHLSSPVLTVYSGSALSERAAAVAVHLAGAAGGRLEILIPAETEEEFEGRRAEVISAAGKMPGTKGLRLELRRIRPDAAASLVSILRAEYRQPIVLPADAVGGEPGDLQRLIDRIDNPVLLVQ